MKFSIRSLILTTLTVTLIFPSYIQCFTNVQKKSFQNTNNKLQHEIKTKEIVESSSSTTTTPTTTMNRRSVMIGAIAFLSGIHTTTSNTSTTNNKFIANAAEDIPIPSISVTEFEEILKASARSIEYVDFTGPKGDNVIVKLLDGTLFTLSDIVESPVDPRSPLSISALCRGYKVPTKFSSLLGAVQSAPKKTKVYMNSREVEAAKKEAVKKERLAKDEEERQEELRVLQEERQKSLLKEVEEQS